MENVRHKEKKDIGTERLVGYSNSKNTIAKNTLIDIEIERQQEIKRVRE